ncbi:hypothetical protein [Virgisporangium aurantiacum]|uniref:hypothetical protein n=1 Tax=Virgisporangium aurantiacum TaxID=175570 RepID=UPI00194E3FFC|nr:hypothetical protein [Virgisporangium aurantiacum]
MVWFREALSDRRQSRPSTTYLVGFEADRKTGTDCWEQVAQPGSSARAAAGTTTIPNIVARTAETSNRVILDIAIQFYE